MSLPQKPQLLRLLPLLIATLAIFPLAAQPRRGLELTTPQRRALVIGNKDYSRQPLLNPANDATDLAASLRDLGFQVKLGLNLDRPALDRTIHEYADSVQEGDTALFFFSGHGMEVEGKYRRPTAACGPF